MNAVIIEDETAAVGSLKAILSQNTRMPVEVVAERESIEESVTYFHNYPQPDIIFMDIHLADGSAFKIFEQVEIAAPVKMCIRDRACRNPVRGGLSGFYFG